MKLFTVPIESLSAIVRQISADNYADNIKFKSLAQASRNAINFTLTVCDSSAQGSRRSNKGRRIAAACWHAHRDVMSAIFSQYPDARLKSALADYRGAADFLDTFEATGETNIGSIAQPMRVDVACNCEEFSPDNTLPTYDPHAGELGDIISDIGGGLDSSQWGAQS